MKTKVCRRVKKNVMISEIAPIHIHLTIRIHSHCESDLIGSDSHGERDKLIPIAIEKVGKSYP
jgi:hypothetical protein